MEEVEEEKDYDIFKDLDDYETIIHQVNREYSDEPQANFCDSITFTNEYKNQVSVLCRKYVSFFKKIKHNNRSYSNPQDHKKYPEYLNFWIRHQLELQSISKYDRSVLYIHLKNNYPQFDKERELENKIYCINEKDYKSMNILYDLYKNYYGSLHEYKTECNYFFQSFKENYDKCLYRCYFGHDSKLCDVMKIFRELYDKQKFPNIQNQCHITSYTSLPELSDYSSEKTTDSEDFNIGYKLVKTSTFSKPFGLPQIKGVNYKELNELIRLQYNMPYYYDDEMKKNFMMKILYQFIKYCRENKKNEKLSSFMKEFIEKYYKKNENEYNDIFADCKIGCKSKIYGQLYKSCKENYGDDLLLIEKNVNSYLEDQKTYIESLSALEVWIFKAQSLFQDFGAMSRISPTVISTMLTPLSSIFRKEKKRRKIPLFFPERSINDVKNHNSKHMKAKSKRGKIRFAYQPN
uniref:Vir5 protein n=1 Tax=Plasmodium vivax TaxID=5855 RepID=Q9N8A1_PLAVI|nr:vir5 [Plasmodium vivax]